MYVRVGNSGNIEWHTTESGQTKAKVSLPLIFEDINAKPIGIKRVIVNSSETEIYIEDNKLDHFEVLDKYFAYHDSIGQKLTESELEKIFEEMNGQDSLELIFVLVIQSSVSDFSNSNWNLFFEIEFNNTRVIEWEANFNNNQDSSAIKDISLWRITHRPITLFNLCLLLFIVALLSFYTSEFADLSIYNRVFFLNSKFLAGVIGMLFAFFGLTLFQVKENFFPFTKRKLKSFVKYPELNIDTNIFKDLESKVVFKYLTGASILTFLVLCVFLPIDISEYQKDDSIVVIDQKDENEPSTDSAITNPYVYWHRLKLSSKKISLNFMMNNGHKPKIGTLTTDWMRAKHKSEKITVKCSLEGKSPEPLQYLLYDLIVNTKPIPECSGFNIRKHLTYKEVKEEVSEQDRLKNLKLKIHGLDTKNLNSLDIGRYRALSFKQIKDKTDSLKGVLSRISKVKSSPFDYLFDKKDSLINNFSLHLKVFFDETIVKNEALLEVFKAYMDEVSSLMPDRQKKQMAERCIVLSAVLKASSYHLDEKNEFTENQLNSISSMFRPFYPSTKKGYEKKVSRLILGTLAIVGKTNNAKCYINNCILNTYLNEEKPHKNNDDEKGDYFNKRLGYMYELAINGLLNDNDVGRSEEFVEMVKDYVKYRGSYIDGKNAKGFIRILKSENILPEDEKAVKNLERYFKYVIVECS